MPFTLDVIISDMQEKGVHGQSEEVASKLTSVDMASLFPPCVQRPSFLPSMWCDQKFFLRAVVAPKNLGTREFLFPFLCLLQGPDVEMVWLLQYFWVQ